MRSRRMTTDLESEPLDLGDMGGAMPEGANRKSNSSIVQNTARISSPDECSAVSIEHVSAAGSIGPGTNSDTKAPKCIDVQDDESPHGNS